MKNNMKYWQRIAVMLGIVLCMAIAPVPIVTALAAGENKNTDFLHGKPFEYLQQQITNLDKEIDDDEAIILALQQQIVTLQDETLALQAKMSAVQQEIQALQTDAGANKLAIENLQTHLGGLQTQFGSLQTQLGGLQTQLANLQTGPISALTAAITAFQTQLADLQTQSTNEVSALKAQIALLEQRTITHPSLAALVAGAYCQARNAPTNYGIYTVSREWSSDGTCESACANFGLYRYGYTIGHYTGHGIGDLSCEFVTDSEGRIISVGGRPDSGYVQADTAYCDWCCCIAN